MCKFVFLPVYRSSSGDSDRLCLPSRLSGSNYRGPIAWEAHQAGLMLRPTSLEGEVRADGPQRGHDLELQHENQERATQWPLPFEESSPVIWELPHAGKCHLQLNSLARPGIFWPGARCGEENKDLPLAQRRVSAPAHPGLLIFHSFKHGFIPEFSFGQWVWDLNSLQTINSSVLTRGLTQHSSPQRPAQNTVSMRARREPHTRRCTVGTTRDTLTSYMRSTWEQPLPSHTWTPWCTGCS